MASKDAHIMIDLETLAETPNAAIVAIAAVGFNPFQDDSAEFATWLEDKEARENLSSRYFYTTVIPNPEAQVTATCVLNFWFKVSEEARQAIQNPTKTEREALIDFSAYVNSFKQKDVVVKVWSKGGIDFTWLTAAYKRNGLTPPWEFRSERDLRTLQEMARDLTGKSIKNPSFKYVAHDALCDVAAQIYQAQECFRMLNVKSS